MQSVPIATNIVSSNPAQARYYDQIIWVRVRVFNATFNNISVISWQPVFLVEETGVPRENH
jgi:hypothetical protein